MILRLINYMNGVIISCRKVVKKKMGFLPKLCPMRCRLSEELFVMLPVGDTRHYAQVRSYLLISHQKELMYLHGRNRTPCADIYTSIQVKKILEFYYHYLPVYGLGSFVPWIGLIYRLKVEPYIFIKTFSAYKRKKIVKKRQKL